MKRQRHSFEFPRNKYCTWSFRNDFSLFSAPCSPAGSFLLWPSFPGRGGEMGRAPRGQEQGQWLVLYAVCRTTDSSTPGAGGLSSCQSLSCLNSHTLVTGCWDFLVFFLSFPTLYGHGFVCLKYVWMSTFGSKFLSAKYFSVNLGNLTCFANFFVCEMKAIIFNLLR